MGSPSRNVQYHPPRLSEDRLNLPQPHSPSLPTHCSGKSGMRPLSVAPAPHPLTAGGRASASACCQPIFLDFQATTPLDPLVLEAMLPWMKGAYNAHAVEHSIGARCGRRRGGGAREGRCDARMPVFRDHVHLGSDRGIQHRKGDGKPRERAPSLQMSQVCGGLPAGRIYPP